MSMVGPFDPGGHLALLPMARPGYSILRSRRPLVNAIVAGSRVADLPRRLASLFSLCFRSHHICSRLALEVQLPGLFGAASPETTAETNRLLVAETIHQHLISIALAWSRLGSEALAGELQMQLPACPALASARKEAGPPQGRMADWLSQNWLGLQAESWLDAWERDGIEWLKAWATSRRTPLARLLDDLQQCDGGLVCRTDEALPVPVDAACAQQLGEALPRLADFDGQPVLQGLPRHTGVWSRKCMPPFVADAWSAWGLLGMRLAELVRLSLPEQTGAQLLSRGAHRLADDWSMAWVEMARGLLVHFVRISREGGEAVVKRCEVISPTDWNFHPIGLAARAMAELVARGGTRCELGRRISLLMAALDPCVPFAIDWRRDDADLVDPDWSAHA